MHRKNCVPRFVCWTVLLGVLVGGAVGAGSVAAQDSPPPSVLVPINGTKKLQMSAKRDALHGEHDRVRLIKTVQNQDANVARVSPIQDDPTSVLVTGLMAGSTRVTLTDKDNQSESFEVIVQLDIAFLRKVLQDTVPSANIVPVPVGSGSIILSGTVSKAEDISIVLDVARSILGGVQLTNALRVGGVQQVELCVTVALVSRTTMRQMSFEFLRTGPNNAISSTLGGVPTFSGTLGPIGPTALNSVITTAAPGNLFYGILTPEHGFFGWLEALRNESVTKILAEPKVTTISGRPASFLAGGDQAIPVPAGLGQVGVQFEEFGTRLNVLPIVLGNGKIHLEVEPEESDLNAALGTSIAGTTVPGRTVQRVHTTVELETGQTFAIGGLVQHKINASASKIPIIGDLPFIGVLFRGVEYTEEEDELLVLVTPHLVDPLACNQLPKYFPGQETRSPDDFELFLEGILEAPRGPRETCPNGLYQAAWKNGPTAGAFPCGNCGFGSRGACDCANGACGNSSSCHGCGTGGTCGAGGCGVSGEAGYPAATAPAIQVPVTTPAPLTTTPAPVPAGVRSSAQPDVGTTAALASVPTAGAATGAGTDGTVTMSVTTGEVNGNANLGTAASDDQR